MTIYDSVNTVLKRLDDYPDVNGERVWTRAEVELYLTDGYNAFARQTKAIFDLYYPENVPPLGNYVGDWELAYHDSGMIAHGLLGYTGGYWERDYALPGARGPIGSTQRWESTYVVTVFSAALPLPEDVVAVDRATHDLHQLSPEWTKFFEQNDRDFETTQGDPWRFSLDRDGISQMRVVPAGTGTATQVETSGSWGLLRDAADTDGLGTWAPSGSWGVLRAIPEHFPMGAQYGIPRRLFSDTDNTRIEYARLGKDWTQNENELPARWVKYVEFYAQAKCLERDGPGQDLALAEHFMERFGEGVRRMVLRLTENRRPVAGKIGASGRVPTKPALARLPWRYGRQIRRGY